MICQGQNQGIITKIEIDFFVCPSAIRITVFYCQPKIHKSLSQPPGRPILALFFHTLGNYSFFFYSLQYLLLPLKDTKQVLNDLHTVTVHPQIFMVTADEASYSNNAHEDGMISQLYKKIFSTSFKFRDYSQLILV